MLTPRRVRGRPALKIIGGVFLLIALTGFAAAGSLVLAEWRSAHTAAADGVITAITYGPIVQFTAANGSVVRFGSPVRSSLWQVGDHVTVAYAPDNPMDATIDGFAGRWFLPALFGLLAGVFALVGGALRLAGRRASATTVP